MNPRSSCHQRPSAKLHRPRFPQSVSAAELSAPAAVLSAAGLSDRAKRPAKSPGSEPDQLYAARRSNRATATSHSPAQPSRRLRAERPNRPTGVSARSPARDPSRMPVSRSGSSRAKRRPTADLPSRISPIAHYPDASFGDASFPDAGFPDASFRMQASPRRRPIRTSLSARASEASARMSPASRRCVLPTA